MATLEPSSSSSPSTTTPTPPSHLHRKRKRTSPSPSTPPPNGPRSTLYDAVAGRLTTRASLLNPSQHTSSSLNRDRIDRSLAPLRPAEALWRSSGAAADTPRYAEHDVYDSARANLPPGARGEGVLRMARGTWDEEEGQEVQVNWDGMDVRKGRVLKSLRTEDFGCVEEGVLDEEVKREREERLGLMRLPDSDLCKGVHTYASDFYGALVMERRDEVRKRERKARRRKHEREQDRMWNFKSMDETALLAMGILLEESVAAVLGETGDMVFVEGETDDRDVDGNLREMSKTVDIVGPMDAMGEDFEADDAVHAPDGDTKKNKRVRIQDDEDSFMEDPGERRRRKKRRRLHYQGNEDY